MLRPDLVDERGGKRVRVDGAAGPYAPPPQMAHAQPPMPYAQQPMMPDPGPYGGGGGGYAPHPSYPPAAAYGPPPGAGYGGGAFAQPYATPQGYAPQNYAPPPPQAWAGAKPPNRYNLPLMPASIQLATESLLDRGIFARQDVDDCAFESLRDFPEHIAVEIINKFGQGPLSKVANKTGFLIGILKRYRSQMAQTSAAQAASAPGGRGRGQGQGQGQGRGRGRGVPPANAPPANAPPANGTQPSSPPPHASPAVCGSNGGTPVPPNGGRGGGPGADGASGMGGGRGSGRGPPAPAAPERLARANASLAPAVRERLESVCARLGSKDALELAAVEELTTLPPAGAVEVLGHFENAVSHPLEAAKIRNKTGFLITLVRKHRAKLVGGGGGTAGAGGGSWQPPPHHGGWGPPAPPPMGVGPPMGGYAPPGPGPQAQWAQPPMPPAHSYAQPSRYAQPPFHPAGGPHFDPALPHAQQPPGLAAGAPPPHGAMPYPGAEHAQQMHMQQQQMMQQPYPPAGPPDFAQHYPPQPPPMPHWAPQQY